MTTKTTRKFMFGVATLAVFTMMFTPTEFVSAQADENKIESSRILQKYEEYHLETDKPRLTIESTAPRDGVPILENAIVTRDGGYVTPLRLVDDEGKPLNIKYEDGIENLTNEKNPPACRGPSSGLYQEGGDWTTTSHSQTIGYSELWQMPTGTITGSNVGIYYNPVNFYYPATGTNYDFFQVDWGIGNNVVSNWIMTYSYVDGTPFFV